MQVYKGPPAPLRVSFKSPDNSSKRWLFIALLTVFAPASGGATQLWAAALLLLGAGAIFLWAPPSRALGPFWNWLFLLLGLLGLVQFLPAAWFALPEWRKTLTGVYGVALPKTRAPQPWLSLEECGMYFAGLGWAYYLLLQRWTLPERHRAARIYGLGVVLLAAVSLGVYLAHWTVPFWPPVRNSPINFGFFPNRNQTANVLALGGIVLMALTLESLTRQGNRGLLWIPLILLVVGAVVVDYSRAGVLIFFGGAAAWLAETISKAESKRAGTLILAGVVLMLAAFLLYGGETLRRFQPEPSDTTLHWTDFRFLIQEDTMVLTAQSPFFGQSLGTFEYLFPLFRDKSTAQNFAIHPESDWLWMASELGWPAAFLLFVGFCYWLPQCFPFERGSDRRIRSAATICTVAFAVHGLGDVSGHRPGAMWPGLFLMSIALHPNRKAHRPRPWTRPAFRTLGVVLVAFALWWLGSDRFGWGDRFAPTSRTLARIKVASDQALAAKDYERMIALTTEGMRLAPLDWHLYFQRAVANAVSHNTALAKEDYARVRFLVPQWADSCYIEGSLWLALEKPDLGWDAWKEALHRAREEAPKLYRRMLTEQTLNAPIRYELEELARSDRDFWLVFLDFANPLECDLQIGDLLTQDPPLLTLSPAQRRALFAVWFDHGNRPLLVSSLLGNPTWLPQGWPWVARDYVNKKQFRPAYELARRFTEPPSLPHLNDTRPINEVERNFFFHTEDLQAGIALYFAQRKLGRDGEALKTLVQLKKLPEHPTYLSFLEGELRAERGEWEKAWAARLEYGPLTPR